ncbi:harmonin-binding protein USHBP1 isoform X2 [Ambystoma mexicanum]|uniref:harmonin-binding protein USHBP1 isoform X2 n=1 Tax=Ambystoma mexicanum TaxID=8296 RepID=UPI0037E8F11A
MESADLDQEEIDLLEGGTEFADLEEVASADGRSMLRYEEHITELLVTITELNGRIEELQQNASREEEEFLDQSSQCTSSLPRCVWQPRSLKITPHSDKECESMLIPGEDESAQLFAELQQALASLENVVSCRRNRTLSLQSAEGGAEPDLRSLDASLEKWDVEKWSEAFEALDEMEGVSGPWSELTDDDQSWYKAEVAGFREKNLVLKRALRGKEADLERSKATLSTFQEERDRLQRKVKDLQDSIQRVESPSLQPSSRSSSFSGVVTPSTEEGDWVMHHSSQDTIATVQSLVHCLKNCSRVRHLCQLLPLKPGPPVSESKIKELEAQLEDLRGCIDKLKCLNDLLVVTLEECKSDSERLNLILGKHESNSTALHLGLQASERRIAAYDVLRMLVDMNAESLLGQMAEDRPMSPEILKWQSAFKEFELKKKTVLSEAYSLLHADKLLPAAEKKDSEGSLWESFSNRNHFGLICEEENLLKDYICKLRHDQASIKVTLVELALKGSTQPADVARIKEVIKAKVDDAIDASLDILPSYARKPVLDRSQLLQTLSELREEMSDLKTELHLREKEKRGLELQALAYRHQESAYLLLTEHLKWKLEDGSEWPTLCMSSVRCTGDNTSSTKGFPESATESNGQVVDFQVPNIMHALTQSLARCEELQTQIEALSAALEKSTREDSARKSQSIQLTNEFFRAHSNLVSAYKNSQRKQAHQLRQLKNQVEVMSRRHQGQVRSLQQRVERLESCRAAQVPGETSL